MKRERNLKKEVIGFRESEKTNNIDD